MLPPAIELCHFAVSNGGVRDYVMRFPDGLDLSPTSIDGLRPTHRLECAIAVCGELGWDALLSAQTSVRWIQSSCRESSRQRRGWG